MAWVLFMLSIFSASPSRRLVLALGGLSRRWRWLHWLGLSTLTLLIIHVSCEVILDPNLALDWSDPFIAITWIGSILMLLAGILSFFNFNNHRLWMQIHWIFPITFVFSFIHGKAYLSESPLEQIIFYIALLVSIISMLFISFKNQLQISCLVTSINQISETMYELGLHQEDKSSSRGFKAGMIIFLRFGKRFSKTWHPFSITSCEKNPDIKLLIKNVGEDTSHLKDLRLGDAISILGPFFEFRTAEDRDQLWIAAGVGIAPFLGMARCLQKEMRNKILLILYLSNKEEILVRELESIQKKIPNFEFKLYIQKLAESVDLVNSVVNLREPVVLVCGSRDFMKKIRIDLSNLEIKPIDIQTEEFF